eukprot:TRINITY_DN4150_c0_g1_i1.p1 TRINITY_DN4150_c0_g1~~TRINITY_DN4150_c0_g1_i1.p1  ORF type:complete len:755 (-),score=143.76 TRINITY_DN4150_c0_g1_i1:1076-3340(-)
MYLELKEIATSLSRRLSLMGCSFRPLNWILIPLLQEEGLSFMCMEVIWMSGRLHFDLLLVLCAMAEDRHSAAVGTSVDVDGRRVIEYLTPCLEAYIKGFKAGFDSGIEQVDVTFMKSDGGLCPVDNFQGFVSILSGPAGGVVGYSQTSVMIAEREGLPPPQVVGFDMGGTSTDVSRVEGDSYQFVQETELDGVFIQATQLDIDTVAAGGGSVLHVYGGNMDVGPASVGSSPGPVCYGRGGLELAVTDANYLLGRILPEYFPFPLDMEATKTQFERIVSEINAGRDESGGGMGIFEAAHGFLSIANTRMAGAVKKVTEAKGFDVSQHVLSVFGGAGPQHACAIAKQLGMTQVFINRFGSILSAYGLGLADEKEEVQEICKVDYEFTPTTFAEIQERLAHLSVESARPLLARGFSEERVARNLFVELRYEGTDTTLPISVTSYDEVKSKFELEYEREFGFVMNDTAIIADTLRVIALGKSPHIAPSTISPSSTPPIPSTTTSTSFLMPNGRSTFVETNVYLLSDLLAGDVVVGPAMVIDPAYFLTIVIDPDCQGTVSELGHLHLTVPLLKPSSDSSNSSLPSATPSSADAVGEVVSEALIGPGDIIERSLYIHRFMNIAEQMGVALQRTSKSVNIKERLDFSCALFNHEGGLVANAPHLPVHLGAMQHAVKWQIQHLGTSWKKGEVLLSNHPASGGSHLPDFTVITPVYLETVPDVPPQVEGKVVDTSRPIFYLASRAHHADIGGITPGSMPPMSK